MSVPPRPNLREMTQSDKHLKNLYRQLDQILKAPCQEDLDLDDLIDPLAQPLVWVSKWVYFPDRAGFGYQLSDGTKGLLFTDGSQLLVPAFGVRVVLFFTAEGSEQCFIMDRIPSSLEKKFKIFSKVHDYMEENLFTSGDGLQSQSEVQLSRTPRLIRWNSTDKALMVELSCGTIQVNFHDHAKLIVCPIMGTSTYFDKERKPRTFRLCSLLQGCTPELKKRLNYLWKEIVRILLDD